LGHSWSGTGQESADHEAWYLHENSIVGPQFDGPAVQGAEADLEIKDSGTGHSQVCRHLPEPGGKPWPGHQFFDTRLPQPVDTRLRADPFADPDWREKANLGEAASALLDRSRR
jgi:hypothetical protein